MSDYRANKGMQQIMALDISLSAGKAIDIFKVICGLREPCSFAEISRQVRYPRTVTTRMLATLVHHEMVEKDPETGLYSVSPILLHTVQKALSNDPVLARVNRLMTDIATRTQDTALFMIRSGDKALVMSRVEGAALINVRGSRVGMELPLHCGGAPFALLAFSSDEYIEDYLSRPLKAQTDDTCIDPATLRTRIKETRARGYSVGIGDLFQYVVALGLPIYDGRGQLAGAVSVGNIIQKYPPERIREVGQILTEIAGQY